MKVNVGWGVVVVLTAAASFASAQDPDGAGERAQGDDELARAHFVLGERAFESGEFETALREFERAYALSERGTLLFNIGTSADRLRRTDAAIDAFERYLDAMPDASNRAQVLARLDVLREAQAREATLRTTADEESRRRRNRILGIVGGMVGAGLVALTLGLVLRGSPPPYEQGDHGVVFALGDGS